MAHLIFSLGSLSSVVAVCDLDVSLRQALAETLLAACLVLCRDFGNLGGYLTCCVHAQQSSLQLEAVHSNGLKIFILTNNFQELQHLQTAKKIENLMPQKFE